MSVAITVKNAFIFYTRRDPPQGKVFQIDIVQYKPGPLPVFTFDDIAHFVFGPANGSQINSIEGPPKVPKS